MKPPGCRREHDSQPGRSAFDQPDIHRIIVAAANELLGSVEGVDEEVDIVMRGDAAGCHLFLRDHRNSGRSAGQRGEDDQLGRAVGFGDGRGIELGFDLEPAPHDLEDRFARFARGHRQIVDQPRMVGLNAAPSGSPVEPHRRGIHVAVLDQEAGQFGIFLWLAEALRERDLRAERVLDVFAASSRPSAS